MKVLWNLEDNLTQKSSDSYEGGDRIRMIFRKMTTKKTVCNLFLNEQKCCTCICKSDTLKKINIATGTFPEHFNENIWNSY